MNGNRTGDSQEICIQNIWWGPNQTCKLSVKNSILSSTPWQQSMPFISAFLSVSFQDVIFLRTTTVCSVLISWRLPLLCLGLWATPESTQTVKEAHATLLPPSLVPSALREKFSWHWSQKQWEVQHIKAWSSYMNAQYTCFCTVPAARLNLKFSQEKLSHFRVIFYFCCINVSLGSKGREGKLHGTLLLFEYSKSYTHRDYNYNVWHTGSIPAPQRVQFQTGLKNEYTV